MKTQFVYKPTIIYLHVCDSLQDIENKILITIQNQTLTV